MTFLPLHPRPCGLLAILLLATVTFPAMGEESASFHLGDRIPARAHTAFWIDDLEDARANADRNPFFQLLIDENHGVGEGVSAIGGALSRLPVSSADPLIGLWAIVLPELSFSLASGVESATSVFHFTANDLAETFSGSLAVYSTLYSLYMEGDTEIVEWDVILTADFPDEDRQKIDAFLEGALTRVPRDATRRRAEYFGHDVYQIRYYLEDQVRLPGDRHNDLDILQEFEVIVEYAFVDGVFLLAEGRGEPLRAAIRALVHDDPSLWLTQSPRYRNAAASHGRAEGNYHLYYDMTHHIRERRKLPSHRAAVGGLEALGLNEAGPVLINCAIDGDELRLSVSLAAPPRPAGVFRMLASFPENDLQRLGLIPRDASSFSSLSIDMKVVYDFFRNFLQTTEPQAVAALDMGTAIVEGNLGLSVANDLLPAVRGEMVNYVRPGALGTSGNDDEPEPTFLLPFRGDLDTVERFNQAIRNLSTGDIRLIDAEAFDVDGVTLWEVEVVQGAGLLNFAVTPNGAILSNNPAEARAILRRLAGGGGEDITTHEAVARLLDTLPRESLRGFVYTNGRAMVDGILRSAARMPGASIPPEDALRRAMGDTWWVLQSRDEGIYFNFVIEVPE